MYDIDELLPTPTEKAVARLGLEESLKRYIRIIHRYTTGTEYTFKPFHDDIITKLEAIAKGASEKKNLLINIPVGFGKSLIVEYFISWCFCRNKNYTFLYTSYGDKLITKLSKEIKDIIESETFSKIWGYKLEKDERSKVNWSIEGSTGRAGLTAGAIGGTITGLDAGNPSIKGFSGALIIDDPISASKVIYQQAREDVINKYESVLKTRLRKSDVPIIVIAQRLHEKDLSGYILEHEADSFEVITIEAMKDNKSIWEEKISTHDLKELEQRRPFVFYSQYQQNPDSNINSMFKSPKFIEDETLIYDGICQVDAGYDGSDFTAFTIMKRLNDGRLIAYGNMWEEHVDKHKKQIINLIAKHRAGTLHLEDNADKGYLANDFHKDGVLTYRYHESMNKHYKIMTYLYAEWNNIYWLPSTSKDYLSQIQCYDENANNDDAPDSASSCVRELTQGGIGISFF
jgi:phage terminase large subunit-like protein